LHAFQGRVVREHRGTGRTGLAIDELTFDHPTLQAALAMIMGAGFGYASEVLGEALTTGAEPSTEPGLEVQP
jgi:hypothetical protein